MPGNTNLQTANRARNDEFYTQLNDIANELQHYKQHFYNKTVLCNCDDPFESNFFKYFASMFNDLHLKKLICTCWYKSPIVYKELPFDDNNNEDNGTYKIPEESSADNIGMAAEPGVGGTKKADNVTTLGLSHEKAAYKIEITEVTDLNNDGATDLSSTALEKEITRLMMDDDVTNKRGIYEYLLSHEESKLNIRAFTDAMKREAYERQEGICTSCHQHFEINEMEGDHITPWSEGGKTTADNCQMLCKHCNRIKSNK